MSLHNIFLFLLSLAVMNRSSLFGWTGGSRGNINLMFSDVLRDCCLVAVIWREWQRASDILRRLRTDWLRQYRGSQQRSPGQRYVCVSNSSRGLNRCLQIQAGPRHETRCKPVRMIMSYSAVFSSVLCSEWLVRLWYAATMCESSWLNCWAPSHWWCSGTGPLPRWCLARPPGRRRIRLSSEVSSTSASDMA